MQKIIIFEKNTKNHNRLAFTGEKYAHFNQIAALLSSTISIIMPEFYFVAMNPTRL